MRDTPSTPEEWQATVDFCEFALQLDAARQYGFVTGGPRVNVEQCQLLLSEGAKRGIHPRPDCIERFVSELISGGSHIAAAN